MKSSTVVFMVCKELSCVVPSLRLTENCIFHFKCIFMCSFDWTTVKTDRSHREEEEGMNAAASHQTRKLSCMSTLLSLFKMSSVSLVAAWTFWSQFASPPTVRCAEVRWSNAPCTDAAVRSGQRRSEMRRSLSVCYSSALISVEEMEWAETKKD